MILIQCQVNFDIEFINNAVVVDNLNLDLRKY